MVDDNKKLCLTEATEKLKAAYQNYRGAEDKCGAAENHRRSVLAEVNEAQKAVDSALKAAKQLAPIGSKWADSGGIGGP